VTRATRGGDDSDDDTKGGDDSNDDTKGGETKPIASQGSDNSSDKTKQTYFDFILNWVFNSNKLG
jgi:hypothetical protein